MKKLYGIDKGGTNLRIAKVNPESGRLESEVTNIPLDTFGSSYDKFIDFIIETIPAGSRVGISSAGVIDEKNAIITYAANSSLGERIPLGYDLRKKGYEVEHTNDTRSELQAVMRFAEGKDRKNVLLATYSTGNNCATAHNGLIDRTNPEFGHQGHMPSEEVFRDMTCGCGVDNHIETYVSGTGAAEMAKRYFRRTPISEMKKNGTLQNSIDDLNENSRAQYTLDKLTHGPTREIIIDNIKGPHIYNALRSNPNQEPQRMIADTQIEGIVESIVRMNVAYRPLDIMILKGGQTANWTELFKPAINTFLHGEVQSDFFDKPEIVRTEIPEDEIGIIGAVADFLNKQR